MSTQLQPRSPHHFENNEYFPGNNRDRNFNQGTNPDGFRNDNLDNQTNPQQQHRFNDQPTNADGWRDGHVGGNHPQPPPTHPDRAKFEGRRDELNRDGHMFNGPQQPNATTGTRPVGTAVEDTSAAFTTGNPTQATRPVEGSWSTNPPAHRDGRQNFTEGQAPVDPRHGGQGFTGTHPLHDGTHPHHARHQGVLEGNADPNSAAATRTAATTAPGMTSATTAPMGTTGPAGAGPVPQTTTSAHATGPTESSSTNATGLHMAGRLQQAAGTLLSSQTLKEKGLEKEQRAAAQKNMKTAERLESAAQAHRDTAQYQALGRF